MPKLRNIALEHIWLSLEAFKSVQIVDELFNFIIHLPDIYAAFKSCNLNTGLFCEKGVAFLKGGHSLSLHKEPQTILIEHLDERSILLCLHFFDCFITVNDHLASTYTNADK